MADDIIICVSCNALAVVVFSRKFITTNPEGEIQNINEIKIQPNDLGTACCTACGKVFQLILKHQGQFDNWNMELLED